MTRLLVSVRTPQEALIALEAGADIIDLKDPAAGALGALPPEVAREIVSLIDGKVPVSATIGDIPLASERAMFAIEHTSGIGVDIVKAGFFGDSKAYDKCMEKLRPHAHATRLVAVLFADAMPEFGILPRLKDAGFYGVMLDTNNKNAGSLEDYAPMNILREFLEVAKYNDLEVGLAGSLRLSHIPRLSPLNPGYLGFRGGLCEQYARTGNLLASRVREAKKLLQESNKIIEYAGWA